MPILDDIQFQNLITDKTKKAGAVAMVKMQYRKKIDGVWSAWADVDYITEIDDKRIDPITGVKTDAPAALRE